jgi:uncharacterized membrane protein
MRDLPTAMRRLARRMAGDERGSVIIIGALLLALMAAASVIAVDLGTLTFERRKAQAAVDLAAISAAAQLDDADDVARAVLADNGIESFTDLEVVLGAYSADAAVPVGERFVSGATPANAVRVVLRKRAPLFFAATFMGGDGTVAIGVEAVGAATDLAAFTIGSRLLALDGGLANRILSETLGTTVSLSVMDYRALVHGKADMLRVLDALAAEADLTAATYQDLLDSEVTMPQLVAALEQALPDSAEPALGGALSRLAGAVAGADAPLQLGRLVSLGPYGGRAPGTPSDLDAAVTIMPLLASAATLAAGDRQVSVDLTAGLPGLVSATLDLAIGERPAESKRTRVGGEGSSVATAQLRLGLRLTAGGSGLLSGATLSLPILLQAAPADATLTDIACRGRRLQSVEIAARPGIASAWIGALAPYQLARLGAENVAPAQLLAIPGLTVTGRAHVESGDLEPDMLSFSAEDVAERRPQTASTDTMARSLVTHLLADMTLAVNGIGLPSALSGQRDALRSQLAPLAGAADGLLVKVLDTLGVGLGEADVTVNGARCAGPGLVG